MAKTKKYYVVWEGNEPGIYDNWTDCQLQIKGYAGAKYKSFKSLEEAKEAYFEDFQIHYKKKEEKTNPKLDWSVIEKNSFSVDAACSGNPGIMEYRGVHTYDATEIFRQGPFKHGTNNIGEFLAIVHVLAFMQKHNIKDKVVYSDSRTAMAWVRKKKANTKLDLNKNPKLKDLVARAEKWLLNNKVTTKILKWETKEWGEIPADFGRK